MNKEWRWWLAEFGLATVVALVAGFVTKEIPMSVLYGLFVGTGFFILREHRRATSRFDRQVSEMEDKALNLPVTLSSIENVDPFISQQVRAVRDETLRLAKEAVEGGIILRARSLAHITTDYIKLARPEDKVFATNYGVGWGTPAWDVVRQITFDLAEKGVDITRVFVESITATPEDKKRMKQEMDRQKEHIHVRFVKESRLPQEARVNMNMIYDRYVGYAFWSKPVGSGIRQIIDEVRFYTRRDELEKAKDLAETVIRLSEEY